MVGREDDRILYDDSVTVVDPVRRGPLALGLAVLALVAGLVYTSLTRPVFGSNDDGRAFAASKPVAAARTGFDASSSDIKACDGITPTQPDFSIVVAAAPAEGRQVVSRVVQFVVVDGDDDLPSERDVQAESLCTLP
jgi:hypothetical protein